MTAPTSMIISVHIRKNAGHSFRAALKEHFNERLYLDYGDQMGSSTIRSKILRLERKILTYKNRRYLLDNYDIIHGHFVAAKYKWFQKDLQYATLLRHPVDRLISNYSYILRHPNHDHPNVQLVHKNKLSLEDFIQHPDTRNVQTRCLRGVPLTEFTFVGLCEDYSNSITLFNAIFAAKLRHCDVENVNPARAHTRYDVEPYLVNLIKRYNAEDFRLYEQGVEIFRARIAQYCPGIHLSL